MENRDLSNTVVIPWWNAHSGVERGRRDDSYNDFDDSQTHSGRNGTTPVSPENAEVIDINEYRWQKHCRGLFHISIAA